MHVTSHKSWSFREPLKTAQIDVQVSAGGSLDGIPVCCGPWRGKPSKRRIRVDHLLHSTSGPMQIAGPGASATSLRGAPASNRLAGSCRTGGAETEHRGSYDQAHEYDQQAARDKGRSPGRRWILFA